MKTSIRLSIIMWLMVIAQTTALSQMLDEKDTTLKRTHPFETSARDGEYLIKVSIESTTLFDEYNAVFDRNGYSGNGYCWQGHITQILEKIDKDLLEHIDFDPEAGSFFAYTDTQKSQERFIELLCPIFQDMEVLEEYIVAADRKRIDD